jgi:hypothetical protein
VQKLNRDMRVEENPDKPKDIDGDMDAGSMVSASTKDLQRDTRKVQNVSVRPTSQLKLTSRQELSKQETRPGILSS